MAKIKEHRVLDIIAEEDFWNDSWHYEKEEIIEEGYYNLGDHTPQWYVNANEAKNSGWFAVEVKYSLRADRSNVFDAIEWLQLQDANFINENGSFMIEDELIASMAILKFG